jgi:hypothetical protein
MLNATSIFGASNFAPTTTICRSGSLNFATFWSQHKYNMIAIFGEFWKANCGVCASTTSRSSCVQQSTSKQRQPRAKHQMPQTPQWPVPNPVFYFILCIFSILVVDLSSAMTTSAQKSLQQAPPEGRLRPMLRVDHNPLSLFSDNQRIRLSRVQLTRRLP